MTDQPSTQPSAPQSQASPVKTSGLAIASFVVSLVFFIPIFSPILAIVLGAVALVKISSSRGALGGKGLAIAGIAIGGTFFLLTCALVPLMLVPAFAKAREQARDVVLRSDLKQIGLCVAMYQADNDTLPDTLQTVVDRGYLKDTRILAPLSYENVSNTDVDGTGHFYYFQIRKQPDGQYPGDVVIAWDKKPLTRNGVNILRVNGEVRKISRQELLETIDKYRDLYVKAPIMPAP